MFKITEVKTWAKNWGYSIIKEKDDSLNGASYYWCKDTDPTATGVALSVSKVATAIYNHMTNEKSRNFTRGKSQILWIKN